MKNYLIERKITRRVYDYRTMFDVMWDGLHNYFWDIDDDEYGGLYDETSERVFYGADEKTVNRILNCPCTSMNKEGDMVMVTRRRRIYAKEVEKNRSPVVEVVYRIKPLD